MLKHEDSAVNGYSTTKDNAADGLSIKGHRNNEGLIGPSIAPAIEPGDNGVAREAQSPYTANRALIRDLTLPPVPNLDIPPSPPGSPPPGTNDKINHFLDLKKQGVHFNEKLAGSSALKNPCLLQKLMAFAGVDESDQYATILPKDVWDPAAFPSWAYKEELAKSQQEVTKRREEERARSQRESVGFVPASGPALSDRGVTSSFGGKSKVPRASAAERVIAGLDRDRTREQVRSRSPKRRKRSRSR